MSPSCDLDAVRRAFAREIVERAGCRDRRIADAFAAVPREAFLRPGPWTLLRLSGGSQQIAAANAELLYQDAPVSLLAEKGLNNGRPSFLAGCIDLCAIRDGDSVVHIGTGTGYYTAVLGRLAGWGQVLGIEYEPTLAARAAENLSGSANTQIVCDDGWARRLAPADAILVNAGTPRLSVAWLDALKPRGRLVVPLAARSEHEGQWMTTGFVFRIVRDDDGYAASATMKTVIYPCIGGMDSQAEAALAAALAASNVQEVRRLRREAVADDARCWLRGQGWALTFD